MAEVTGLTADRTLELFSTKAPLDGTLQIIVYDGIAWPETRTGNNILWLDTSGTAPVPLLFDSQTDILVQPGLA